MNDESFLFIMSSLTFILILITAKYSKSFLLVNLIVFVTYSFYFYYGLYFQGSEGRSLGWLIVNLFFTGLHLLLILGYIIKKNLKKSEK